jgi:hypothetical protein
LLFTRIVCYRQSIASDSITPYPVSIILVLPGIAVTWIHHPFYQYAPLDINGDANDVDQGNARRERTTLEIMLLFFVVLVVFSQ